MCADLKFNPEKNRLTLSPNGSGSFTATAIAKSDGNPSELDARLTETENAAFSPTRAGGRARRFEYSRVATAAQAGSKVRVKVRATSKAGVAEDKWEQPIKPPFEINEITGGSSGSFARVYTHRHRACDLDRQREIRTPDAAGHPGRHRSLSFLKAGVASFHYSGQTLTEHADCDMSGQSGAIDLFQHGGGSIGVSPVDFMKPFEQGPHHYERCPS